eukprot:Nk52_evm14s1763 gene=Nk52_evmTU14s1763
MDRCSDTGRAEREQAVASSSWGMSSAGLFLKLLHPRICPSTGRKRCLPRLPGGTCTTRALLVQGVLLCVVVTSWYSFPGPGTASLPPSTLLAEDRDELRGEIKQVGIHSYRIWDEAVDGEGRHIRFDGQRGKTRKAAILYLMKGKDKEINEIINSIRLLQKFFNRRFGYPVLIFYEKDEVGEGRINNIGNTITQALHAQSTSLPPTQQGIDPEFGAQLVFVGIKFEFPGGFNGDINLIAPDVRAVFESRYPGYNHMIRFWFKMVFEHPLVKQLDYYCRLDTDSYIESDIEKDLFELGEDIKYAYVSIEKDMLFVTRGMEDEIERFVESHPNAAQQMKENKFELLPKEQRATQDPFLVYNNFEICHVPTFRSRRFIEFVEHIDSTNQIYLTRWGDAPLRYYEIHLLLDVEKEVKRLCGFNYRHTNANYVCRKQNLESCNERQNCRFE